MATRQGRLDTICAVVSVSMEAVSRYAGDSPELAVLYPGDEAFGLVPDQKVTHFDVLETQRVDTGATRDDREG